MDKRHDSSTGKSSGHSRGVGWSPAPPHTAPCEAKRRRQQSSVVTEPLTPPSTNRSTKLLVSSPGVLAAKQAYLSAMRVTELVESVEKEYSTSDSSLALKDCMKISVEHMLEEQEDVRRQALMLVDGGSRGASARKATVSPVPPTSTSTVSSRNELRPATSPVPSNLATPTVLARNVTDGDVDAVADGDAVDLFHVDDNCVRRLERRTAAAKTQHEKRYQEQKQTSSPDQMSDRVAVDADACEVFQRSSAKQRSHGSESSSLRDNLDRVTDLSNDARQVLQDTVLQLRLIASLAATPHEMKPGHESNANGGGQSTSETINWKQIRTAAASAAQGVLAAMQQLGDVCLRTEAMEKQLSAQDTSTGPLINMLRMTREELLLTKQHRDEARRELMLHRVGSRFRALVRRGRELRGEEYAIVTADCNASPTLGQSNLAPATSATLLATASNAMTASPTLAPGGKRQRHSAVEAVPSQAALDVLTQGAIPSGNVNNAHVVASGLTPALRLQSAAMARNAFRLVPPRSGASPADVERAEAELTHCIANVDVILATVVQVSIAEYDSLWSAMPFVMRPSVRVFNEVVDRVARQFDNSALVYRSRGSVSFAPHGGYHLLLFRNPHDAVQFAATLQCALLLAPWPEQLVDLAPPGGEGRRRHSVPPVKPSAADAIHAAVSQPVVVIPELTVGVAPASVLGRPASHRQPQSHAHQVQHEQAGLLRPAGLCLSPYDVSGVVRYSPSDMVKTLQQSPLWPDGTEVAAHSGIDVLIKNLEQFEMQRSMDGQLKSIDFGSALSIAETMAAHVAIGPARVHELFDQPLLFRGLRAKVGIHTGIVFIEGSIRDAQVSAPHEDTEASDVAYSYRPAFGKVSSLVSAGDTAAQRRHSGSMTTELLLPGNKDKNKTAAQKDGVTEQDAFYGSVNAKVPLLYGAAVMKAALLCGMASGGETVMSQQTHAVTQGALDAWGVFCRPVNYHAESPLFAPVAPVVNDLPFALFDVGEVCYQILPQRFVQRVFFFPSTGDCSLYNPTWWLPFHPELDAIRKPTSPCTEGLTGSQLKVTASDRVTLTTRIKDLENFASKATLFLVGAAHRARTGRAQAEAFERAAMASHDAAEIIHAVNLMQPFLRGMETTIVINPAEVLPDAVERALCRPALHALQPLSSETYAETLLGKCTYWTAHREIPASVEAAASPAFSVALRLLTLSAHAQSTNTPAARSDMVNGAPWCYLTYQLVAEAIRLVEVLASFPLDRRDLGAEEFAAAIRDVREVGAFASRQVESVWGQFIEPASSTAGTEAGGPQLHCFLILVATTLVCEFAVRQCAAGKMPCDSNPAAAEPTPVVQHMSATIQSWNEFATQRTSSRVFLVGMRSRSVYVVPEVTSRTHGLRWLSALIIPTKRWIERTQTLLIRSYTTLLQALIAEIDAVAPVIRRATPSDISQPEVSGHPLAATSSSGVHMAGGARHLDEQRFDHDARLIAASTYGDFRSWVRQEDPIDILVACCEGFQQSSSTATFLGFTVYCEEPQFPFAPLRDLKRSEEESLRIPSVIRKMSREVLRSSSALYGEARRLCRYVYPSIGTVEHELRAPSTGATHPTVTLLYPDFTTPSALSTSHLSSIDRICTAAYTAPGGDATSASMWSLSHVESWGLSLALALSAVHELGGAVGFVSPWSVVVPVESGSRRVGEHALILEHAALLLWKLTVSRTSGHDAVAHHLIGSGASSNAPPQLTASQVVDLLPPEVLEVLSGLVEENENPQSYASRFIASYVSGAASGAAQTGPFDPVLDIKACDVWMFGVLLWYLATGGITPVAALRKQQKHSVQTNDGRHDTHPAADSYADAASNTLKLFPRTSSTTQESCVRPSSTTPTTTSLHVVPAARRRSTVSPAFQAVVPAVYPGASSPHPALTSPLRDSVLPPEIALHGGLAESGNWRLSPSVDSVSAASKSATTAFNLFGTMGNLTRQLRLCLLSKRAVRMAPYRLEFLWPSIRDETLASDASTQGTTPQELQLEALCESVDQHQCTSFVLLVDLLHKMLQVDPRSRISMRDVLRHPFFGQVPTRVAEDGAVDVALPRYVALSGDSGTGRRAADACVHPNQLRSLFGGIPQLQVIRARATHEHISSAESPESPVSHSNGSTDLLSIARDRGPVFQCVEGNFVLGVPFVTSAVSTVGESARVALSAAGAVQSNLHAVVSSGTNTPAGMLGGLEEHDAHQGLALISLAKDTTSLRRREAAREVVRLDAQYITEAFVSANKVLPMLPEMSEYMAGLLGIRKPRNAM